MLAETGRFDFRGLFSWIFTLLLSLCVSCGQKEFSASDSTIQNSLQGQPLTWFWPCFDRAKEGANAQVDGVGSLIGEGVHRQSFGSDLGELAISFEADLCSAGEQSRDILFVVDTSGSMEQNDPLLTNDRCGRLDAVEKLVHAFASDPTVQFALITFDDEIGFESPSFTHLEADLFAPMGNKSETLCAHKVGTHYDVALSKAIEIVEKSRVDAVKELYLISDGAPNAWHDGVAIADQLKQGVLVQGKSKAVTIATIMLAGEDEIMEKKIASRGPDGKPLHVKADRAENLADALSQLAHPSASSAQIRYRAIGALEWLSLDLAQSDNATQTSRFAWPPVVVQMSEAAAGIEVEYDHWNNLENSHPKSGSLVWQ